MQKLHARLVVGVLFLLSLAACALSGGPRAPAALVASPGPAVIVLAWQDNSQDEDGFVLYRKSAASEAGLAEEDFSQLAQTEAEVSSYRDEAVETGRYYLYRVTALRGELESAAATSEAVQPEPARTALTVEVLGDGTGAVTSEPPGIDCSSENRACSANFEEGTRALLEAVPGENSAFAGWGEACEGTAPCDVLLNASKTVTATFERSQFVLSVSRTGAGQGKLVSSPPGIDCGNVCEAVYDKGLNVSITAYPESGSIFAGWSGNCDDSDDRVCVVTMDQDLALTGDFTFPAPTIKSFDPTPETREILRGETAFLKWQVTGRGTIQLRLKPGDLEVTGKTDLPVTPEVTTVYTLTANSEYGEDAMSTIVEVVPAYPLTVELEGQNLGHIVSVQPSTDISCGSICTALFEEDTEVILQVTSGSLRQWDGCTREEGATCTILMDRPRTVIATFE